MSTLSPIEIAAYALNAGCPAAQIPTAVAIAMAESRGGDPSAHCNNCVAGVREDSRGLWQINLRAHPEYSSANLYDPAVNAQAMFEVSGGCQRWRPWSTYLYGQYRQYLGQGQAAADALTSSPAAPSSSLPPVIADIPAPADPAASAEAPVQPDVSLVTSDGASWYSAPTPALGFLDAMTPAEWLLVGLGALLVWKVF